VAALFKRQARSPMIRSKIIYFVEVVAWGLGLLAISLGFFFAAFALIENDVVSNGFSEALKSDHPLFWIFFVISLAALIASPVVMLYMARHQPPWACD
jgi:dipeptide/tripeptide permease